MLRLKGRNITIVPEHITYISVRSRQVYIGLVSAEEYIEVNFKTNEDAVLFRTYVELLIDFSNNRQSDYDVETRRRFESYFEGYLMPSALNEGREEVMKHVNANRKAEKGF